ncbi:MULTISPECIES: hypothetical protein [unclassified Rhodococcus (in: high G+C Gram-positive bacteria)]|uniref:hypothetical protein n=1 Tax=unclassified Rhodococcus (in: high G+C Gram-positive bacteria) TaxID=192944 RepID=UPI001A03EAF3|nr:hypothetical protein [Rhodococcus sp. (in: high G+C Gram-positive bacteria)]MBF0663821.1 hypothetical protein [Rhodococcus sp. (in: high G+C Gram-positive bacteria)]
MFSAEQSRTVALPPLVLGGLRPLYRQMAHNHVHSASFEYLAAGATVDVCVLVGAHGPELKLRVPDRDLDITFTMSTHFRVVPVMTVETYRTLCDVAAPGAAPSPQIVVDFLRRVVVQSPAVLSRTHACAA